MPLLVASMPSLSFLLLHEVPDETKKAVINRIMKSVKVGGKAFFIEYHKAKWYRYEPSPPSHS